MKLLKRHLSRAGLKLLFVLTATFMMLPEPNAEAQLTRKRAEFLEQKQKEKQKFPDEYSELDENKSGKVVTDEIIASTLESSRQSYLQALILIKRGDTVSAARHFQQAIDILNKLVSYPNIDKNEDFSDLAQSIVEDYETYVTNIETLDENASLFIVRDKLFQEIEKMPASPGPVATKLSPDVKIPYPNRHSNPDKMVIPLIEHDLVNRNITFLTKNKHGINFMKNCLERSGKWFPMMRRIALSEGMPEELIYLSMNESALNPNAVSRASAVGLWQFMRATGQDYKLNDKESYWVDERRDPEKSTLAAMKHLRDLYNEFGDWHLALAAYNCGTGCVRRAIRKSGKEKPTFWEIINRLPKETQNYVPSFIATVKVAMNPEMYGYDLNEINYQKEYKYDIFPLDEPVNLTAIAKAAGISLEELKEYNPELIQSISPADRKTYYIKLPFKTADTFAKGYAALTPEEKQPFIFHTVDRNESLEQIARKYNISTIDLVDINGLSGYKAKVKRGDKLRVPIGGMTFEEAQSIAKNDTAAPAEEKLPSATEKSPKMEETNVGQIVSHVVQRGETIYSIANRYGIRSTDLRNLNNLSFDDENIQVGQRLIIAKNKITEQDFAQSKQTTSKDVIVKHKVRKGETLAKIADNYNVTIADIKSANRLRKNTLKAGQILKIKTTEQVQQNTKTVEPVKQDKQLAVHLVKKGETLGSIAQQYNVTEDQLRDWNKNDIKGSVIIAGSRIKVQDNAGSSKGSASSKPKSKAVYYKIKSGDTLGAIARKYGVSVAEIKRNNRNLSETSLQIGQNIRIK